jgi:hypothetical protein
MGSASGDGGSCSCNKTCQIQCLGNCCLEDILSSACTPDPMCLLGGLGGGDGGLGFPGGGGFGDLGLPIPGLDL